MREYSITIKFTKTGIEKTYNMTAKTVVDAVCYMNSAITGDWEVVKATRGESKKDCMSGLRKAGLAN